MWDKAGIGLSLANFFEVMGSPILFSGIVELVFSKYNSSGIPYRCEGMSDVTHI